MEQIIVTPITPFEFILGKTVFFCLDRFCRCGPGYRRGSLLVRGADPGKPSAALLCYYPLPDDDLRDRAPDLDAQPNPATGHDDYLFLFHAVDSPLGIDVPYSEHAGSSPMAHLFESDALLLGDHPGYLPQGGGISHSLVPDGGPGRNGPFHFMALLEEIPQDPRLIIWIWRG